MHTENVTLTTEALNPRSYNMHAPAGCMEHARDDLIMYVDHLWKEATCGVTILNLSVQKGANIDDVDDGDVRCTCAIFDCDDKRTGREQQLTLTEVKRYITESSSDDLRHGKIACGDIEYIHVFNDPDFDLEQTSYPVFQWLRNDSPLPA
jgi:hypothetical protein